ncbi:MAG: beta-lactamase family protein [Bacteroidetes bacterium]|nr:beta-lactamase family protein [Bacteroidota bacterium]
MKSVLKFLRILFVLLLLACAILYFTPYRYLFKGVASTYLRGRSSAHYLDKAYFKQRTVPNAGSMVSLPHSSKYNRIPLSAELLSRLSQNHSGSFLVLYKDSLLVEKYFNPVNDTTRTNSFSAVKTVITLLVQLAIQDGKIKSWDQKVVDFLPWLKGEYAKDLTLRHLSTMTSGSDWDESYHNPFGITARAYYSDDILSAMKTVQINQSPGAEYRYQSGNTQLLGMALQAAVKMPVSNWLSEKLWKPLGMESEASWHLDAEDGTELMYCCLNARSRDFARIGQMLLHNGGGLIDSSFIAMATQPYKSENYGHAFWLGSSGTMKYYNLQGIQGQYIAVVPDKHLVIVRTGEGWEKKIKGGHSDLQFYVDESVRLFTHK